MIMDQKSSQIKFGNAAFRMGRYEEAINHYLKVSRDGHPLANLARFNISLARNRLSKEGHQFSGVRELTKTRLDAGSSRGTFILTTHDTGVGGAQHLLGLFAKWLQSSTRFSVQIVALKGGSHRHLFEKIAPVIILEDYDARYLKNILAEWLSPDAVCIFVNSIASAGALREFQGFLPVIAFIHELPNILDCYPEEVNLIRSTASRVIAGGPDVYNVLAERYNMAPEKLYSCPAFIESLPQGKSAEKCRCDARLLLDYPETSFIVMGCGVLHWRKSPDIFIEVAERVLSSGLDAYFIWLGGGPDEDKCQKMVCEKGLEGRVCFTGYEPKVPEKIAAADLFLLSSQEDPFPLVALYAAQVGLPIVCFQKGGGIESFVAEGSGIATPFMDADAMAQAVLAYAQDASSRKAAGLIGQQQVKRRHTIDVAGPILLNHLREVAGIAPEVSVVLPNYNHEAYLTERLNSISAQTFQDFEVILLDDASCDGSARLLQDFSEMRQGSQILINSENSGSPFVQWMRGMDMARADLIWLAEADDRCTPDFLETMLPFFDDRNLRIASCASQPITADGAIAGDYRPLYLNRINAGRWDKDYIATDHEEANAGLGIANSIPNASAVLFRKFRPEPEFVQELSSMRLCGDWYFYVRAMRGGLVGFSAKLMNDHRRHGSTVTHQLEGSLRYFDELATVRNYLGRTYNQSLGTLSRITEFLQQDIERFNVLEPDALAKADAPCKKLPSLLVVAPDLSPGGGQVFSISVANEWVRIGGRVIMLNVANQPSHPAMLAKIAPEVTCIDASAPGADLATLIQRFDIDAIHSSIWWSDCWVDNHLDDLPPEVPWVITMHGCHETILQAPQIDPSFSERMKRMIERASWVYTAEKNLEALKVLGWPKKLCRIPNGMPEETDFQELTRKELGLRADSTVICLASRAIVSKGWYEAVRLTKRLNDEGHVVDLMLIGEGPVANEIRNAMPQHVYLIGQVVNVQVYLNLADIGLLPSYFVGESMPLVLIEMMAKSLPIVASDIGEIPWMLGRGAEAAGLLVPLKAQRVDQEALYTAVKRMLVKMDRESVSCASRRRFEKEFTLQRMISQYRELYTHA